MVIGAHCPVFAKKEILIGTTTIPQYQKQLLDRVIHSSNDADNTSLRQGLSIEFVSTRDFFRTTDSSVLTKLANSAKPKTSATLLERKSEILYDASGTNVTSFWKTESYIKLNSVLTDQGNKSDSVDEIKISGARILLDKRVEVYTSIYVVKHDCDQSS